MHAPNSGAMSQTTRRLATALLGLVVFAGLIAADELILCRHGNMDAVGAAQQVIA